MIYDCFTFFNELDLLEIRLNVLNDYTDYFVLVEATKTFTGNDKPLYYQENKERFKQFENKIIHIVVDTYPDSTNPWILEHHQRNAIARGFVNCKDDDIILISDLDEIPRPELINKYKEIDGVKLFEQHESHYYLNCIYNKKKNWLLGTKMLTYQEYKHFFDNEMQKFENPLFENLNQGVTPSRIRYYKKTYHIPNGGWHFTYLGSAENIKYKLESFSHSEIVEEGKSKLEYLKKALKQHKGYTIVPIDDFFPEYILKNQEKYRQYICEADKLGRFKHSVLCFFRKILYKYNEYSGFQKRKVIVILGFKIKIKWRQR